MTIRAVQDDITLLGDPIQIFGLNNVREQLKSDLQARGYKYHPTKKFAYGRTAEDCSIIPVEYIQDFREVLNSVTGETDRVYRIIIHGVPHGHKEYTKCWLREKGKDLAAQIDKISTSISAIDPHSDYVTTYYSLPEMGNFIMATSTPSLTKEFATIVDAAIQRAYCKNLGLDLLDPASLQPINSSALENPHVLRQRAILRASRGGVGIRLLDSGSAFLNCIYNCAPKFIHRKDEYGNVLTKGLFQKLSSVFGVGSLDVGKEDQRWSSYLQLKVDPYGHNLLTVAGILGSGTYLNHNTVTGMISKSLKDAGISHKGSSRQQC